MVTAVTWGLYVFGLMITTVAINAYLLDSYPNASGEVAAWISFGRTLGGFFITFFQVKWAKAMGTEKSFGIQAGICAAAFLLVVILQGFGKKLRTWQGGWLLRRVRERLEHVVELAMIGLAFLSWPLPSWGSPYPGSVDTGAPIGLSLH